jgi:hypothetical protein
VIKVIKKLKKLFKMIFQRKKYASEQIVEIIKEELGLDGSHKDLK